MEATSIKYKKDIFATNEKKEKKNKKKTPQVLLIVITPCPRVVSSRYFQVSNQVSSSSSSVSASRKLISPLYPVSCVLLFSSSNSHIVYIFQTLFSFHSIVNPWLLNELLTANTHILWNIQNPSKKSKGSNRNTKTKQKQTK